jgi:hypothetical protein
MTNYYNSGLYMESFFTKHKHLGLDYDYLLDEMLGCNYHLFLKHYSDDLDYKNDDDLKEQISNLFLENIDWGFPRKGANFFPTCLNAFVHKACRG